MSLAAAGFSAVLMALTAGPAVAFTCARLGAVDTYLQMTGGNETYILVLGSFGDLRQVDGEPPFRSTTWEGRFTGFTASALAFDTPFEADVTFRSFYLPSMPKPAVLARTLPGKVGLFWIQDNAAGFLTDYNPCTPNPETDPSRIRQYLDCINGRECTPHE
ncbi:MAG: hypothetical protein ACKO1H_07200 [Tabrizicola sp.]